MNFNNSGFIAMTSVFKAHQGLELLLFACSRHRGTISLQPRQANEKKGNKGIRDAGSTADFRILFEIFEILEKFDFV